MNYNHIYHAGNFADVFKHLTLIFCLEKLQEKETPFFVLDSHAGCGKYDLSSNESAKTGEASNGIHQFLRNCDFNNKNLVNYLKILAKINLWKSPIWMRSDGKSSMQSLGVVEPLRFYPGSPYIIKYFLRPQDHAVLAEIRKAEFALLKRNFAGNPKVQYLNEDGFELLKSKLPPLEKRGLILIDPAFEKGSDLISKDYAKTILTLKDGLKRFAHGIYLVWHPIINKENEEKILEKFYQEMRELKTDKLLHLIFSDDKNIPGKMNACGMFVINAPWGLEEKLRTIFGNQLVVK